MKNLNKAAAENAEKVFNTNSMYRIPKSKLEFRLISRGMNIESSKGEYIADGVFEVYRGGGTSVKVKCNIYGNERGEFIEMRLIGEGINEDGRYPDFGNFKLYAKNCFVHHINDKEMNRLESYDTKPLF